MSVASALGTVGGGPGTVPNQRAVNILVGVFIDEAFGQGHVYNF